VGGSNYDQYPNFEGSVDGDTSSRYDDNFSVLGDEQMEEDDQNQCKPNNF
jgi:hypothetical protein